MRRTLWLVAVVVGAWSLAGHPGAQTASSPLAKTRIGIFDSRMVALAYYNTEEHRNAMRQIMTELKEAKAANAEAKVKELEFQGPALQNLMHYQVFSTASIPNVTEKLAGVLPKVAEEAGVSLIVSKWEVVYRRSDVEYVDVTDALVKQFNPDARVQGWIAEGRTKDPIPLLQAVKTIRAEQ